jgi:hypothetical protein
VSKRVKLSFGEKVKFCGNLLNRGDILLHQSQKEFNGCDFEGDELGFI